MAGAVLLDRVVSGSSGLSAQRELIRGIAAKSRYGIKPDIC